MNINIPNNVKQIIDIFYKNNYEAYMVRACVRDSLLGKSPKDYDITTSAKPEITQKLFEKTIPTGLQHGTITVMVDNEAFEVTTYRTEGQYIDNRRPEHVNFVSNIKEDLARRDFTINSFAYNDKNGLIDYFQGMSDLNNKVIRTVGNPNERFQEDALRMLRAIRFSCQLDFSIDSETFIAIVNNSALIKNISIERIRDELCKILITDKASKGIDLLRESGILEIILPEIYALVDYTPKCNNHNRNVFTHTLKVIDNTDNELILRLAALFHDVGKLNTMTALPNGHYYFPGHSEEGAKMTKEILTRLRFDNNTINKIYALIHDHLVLYVDIMPSDYEIKKLINKVGTENIFTLFELQRADINSLWDPVPFLKKVKYIEDKVIYILENKQPLVVKDLTINGKELITELNINPGKQIGEILDYLLDKVLENPTLNSKEKLQRWLRLIWKNLNNMFKIIHSIDTSKNINEVSKQIIHLVEEYL